MQISYQNGDTGEVNHGHQGLLEGPRALLTCKSVGPEVWPFFGWLACVLVAQSCPTLCHSTNCSPRGFSVRGILQARILEWIAILFSRGSSRTRDWAQVSYTAGAFFTIWATGKKGEYRNFFRRGMLRCQKWGFYPGGLSCVPSFILSRWWRLGVLNFVRETPAITC